MNRFLLWLNILLAAGAAGLAARAVATAVRPLPPTKPSTAAAAPSAAAPRPSQLKPLGDYVVIEKRDLFGVERAEEEPAASSKMDVAALDRTRLTLKLWGTISGGGHSYAVIEDPKLHQQLLYRTGDVVQGAQVKMILREKVVLTVNDQDEVLLMEEEGKGGSPDTARTISAPPVATVPSTARARTTTEEDDADAAMPIQQVTLNAESMEGWPKAPDDLLQQIRFRVQTEENGPSGVLLTGIRPDSVFRKMGLRSGDLVTGSDGGAVDSPEALSAVVERLSSGSGLSLELRRRGKPTSLKISVQ